MAGFTARCGANVQNTLTRLRIQRQDRQPAGGVLDINLTVSGQDLVVLGIVAVLVLALALPLYNRIMLASFNPQLAAVRGVAVKTLDYLFVVLVTLVTVTAVKVIGAILVGALLVIPAAAARLVSQSLKGFFFLSVVIATISTLFCGCCFKSCSS